MEIDIAGDPSPRVCLLRHKAHRLPSEPSSSHSSVASLLSHCACGDAPNAPRMQSARAARSCGAKDIISTPVFNAGDGSVKPFSTRSSSNSGYYDNVDMPMPAGARADDGVRCIAPPASRTTDILDA